MLALWFLAFPASVLAISLAPPTVVLDSASVTGINNGTVHKFLGIPFASPPIGSLRFRLPQALGPYKVDINATKYGPSCLQQRAALPPNLPQNVSAILSRWQTVPDQESEDCLTLNVVRPAFVNSKDRFPVIVWIYGGGFQFGDTRSYDRMSKRIVDRSVALDSPIIFVSMNYRLSAFGFLASKEVQYEEAGNAGLVDQREALHFVQKYITNFGGDPSQVMLWGESAGAISISLQMLGHAGMNQGLFHSAFMQSGAPIPVGDVSGGQKYYDFLVSETGCQSQSDTLACLRTVPLKRLRDAVHQTPNMFSYSALALTWSPRSDGGFLFTHPQKQVQQGKVINIPFVSGNCDDEGTLFSFSSTNVTSEVDFREHIGEVWFPSTPASQLKPLWSLYPSDPTQGSPFDTGFNNSFTPQFKRIAAFQGDITFQAPRRLFLQSLSGKQRMWSYLTKLEKSMAYVGSYHTVDFAFSLLDDYVINFAVNHDPDNATGLAWPEYTAESPQLYTFGASKNIKPTITQDTYRLDAMDFLTNFSLLNPL